MRYLACIFALLFLPLTGHAQINVDTLQAFLDNDKNCGDFQGVIEATRHHRALQIIVNDDDADPHGLDRDGNGVACESKTILRRITPGDTTDFWYETTEEIETANCPVVSEPFNVENALDDIRELPTEVMSDSTEYAQLQAKVTCLRNLGLLSEGIAIAPPPDTGDGENLGPVIDSLSIETADHPSDNAHFDVTWGASDENGNLDSLSFELRNLTTGEVRGTAIFPAEQWGDSTSASNNPGEPFRFVSQNEDGSGDTYQIKITAIDELNATGIDSAQVVEETIVENVAPVVDSLHAFPVDDPDPDANFIVTWGASDEDGNLDVIEFDLWNATTGNLKVDTTFDAENWGDGQSASNDPGTPFEFAAEGENNSGDTYELRMFAIDSLDAQDSDSVLVIESEVVPGEEPSFTYAQDCYTNVNNATVHSPVSRLLPNGEYIAEGDTIAAVSPRGNCVGHNSADSSGRFTLAVAAKSDSTINLPDTSGMEVGEDFSFEIYDKSEDLAYSMWPIFTPCEEVDVPICKDLGGYEDDVFFQVDSLQQEKPSYEDTTMTTGSITVGVTTTYPYSEETPALQVCGPNSPDEVIEIDASRARKYANDSGTEWTDWIRRDTSTATGNGYVVAQPSSPEDQPLPQDREGALFSVPIDFCATGSHYMWLRVAHGGGGGGANSFHVRDPTNTWHSYNDIHNGKDLAEASAGEWVWANTGGSSFGVTEQGPMVLEVPSTGLGKILVRMREGGLRIDKIMLTPSGSYTPMEEGI